MKTKTDSLKRQRNQRRKKKTKTKETKKDKNRTQQVKKKNPVPLSELGGASDEDFEFEYESGGEGRGGQRPSKRHKDSTKQTQSREMVEVDENYMQGNTACLIQLQTELVEAVMEATLASGDRQAAQKMLKASERLVGLAIEQIRQAAFDQGRAEGLSELIHHLKTENTNLKKQLEEGKPETEIRGESSYADILRTTAPAQKTNPEGGANRGKSDKDPTTTAGQPPFSADTNSEATEGLIIRPSDPRMEAPFEHVRQTLNRSFTPHELGLDNFACTKIREGAIVTSTNREGLERLQRLLETKKETAGHFETRIAEKRLPQISVTAVDPNIEEEELKIKIIEQNKIEGNSNDIKLMRTFERRDQTKTHILEVTPDIYQQIYHMEKLLIGWTYCPMRENVHTNRCTICCKYGHTSKNCRGVERCSECAGPHHYTHCDGEQDAEGYILPNRCPACTDNNEKLHTKYETNHSFYDQGCPSLGAEQAKVRARTKYN